MAPTETTHQPSRFSTGLPAHFGCIKMPDVV